MAVVTVAPALKTHRVLNKRAVNAAHAVIEVTEATAVNAVIAPPARLKPRRAQQSPSRLLPPVTLLTQRRWPRCPIWT